MLKAEQQAQFREWLTGRLEELRESVKYELSQMEGERYNDLLDQVHDRGEESFADLLAELEFAVTQRSFNELREVEEALARLDQGGYGSCVDCGCDIPLARLNSQPAACRCLACQEKYEQ